ncbi:CBASS cGAMP-activated phospholipase [Silanimonas sp.]|uniref:CBASS cGAMP-activated phospholipase n=1 Tax=Silanimonas sp. TaxID=1929290 RepID=UPI0025F14CA1|nr:CBASS cGAMP-activated phospholipase [Silanimonas sp.]
MRVLAIDGGGIRGIYASHVLERIQNSFGTQFHRDFDLIAGTSTGSIIAAALAFEIPISDVTKLYREQGPLIFCPRRWSFGGAFLPRYKSDPLRAALNEVFQDATLSDAKARLIIPATDIGNGGVHVFKSAYDESFVRDRDVRVVDAVVASCSAPSYFAPARVGPYQLSDGGLWANNPSLVAVTEALTRLGAERSEIRLLSVGTGIGKNYYPIVGAEKRWGFLTGWGIPKFISMLLNLQAATASNVTQLLLDKHQTVRINFESDLPLSLDDVGTLDDLITKADKDFTHNSKAIRQLLGETQ